VKESLRKRNWNNQIIALLSFYYNHGYIGVSVKKPVFIFSKNKKYVTIVIRVVEGPQYKISNVNLEINMSKRDQKNMLLLKIL